MPRDLSQRKPPEMAVAIGATTPAGKPGAVIWSTTENCSLEWDGSSWKRATPTGGRLLASRTYTNNPHTSNGIAPDYIWPGGPSPQIAIDFPDIQIGDFILGTFHDVQTGSTYATICVFNGVQFDGRPMAAPVGGNSGESFRVAAATSDVHAVRLGQILDSTGRLPAVTGDEAAMDWGL